MLRPSVLVVGTGRLMHVGSSELQDIVAAVQNARNPTTGKVGLMTMDDVRGCVAVSRVALSAAAGGWLTAETCGLAGTARSSAPLSASSTSRGVVV